MCDPMSVLGLGLGIAQGVASVAGKRSAAEKNKKAAVDNQRLNLIQNQRENVQEKDAALKEAHKAALERDRAKATAVASSGNISGASAGARVAEQSRQGALSISTAFDRASAADANYLIEGQAEEVKTANYISTQTTSPLAEVFEVVGSGLKGYQQFARI